MAATATTADSPTFTTPPNPSNPPTAPVSNTFTFPTGDVGLLATHNGVRITGLVSSSALVLASPVWKKFLFPPWSNDDKTESEEWQKQIDCSEDDGEALLVLLNIAHLNFCAVPKVLGYKLLFQVAVLVDQYDCIGIVQPWLQGWMMGEEIASLQHGQEGWLFIAWAFGREKTFKYLAAKIVRGIEASWDETAATRYTIPEPVPPGIVGKYCSPLLMSKDGLLLS